MFGLWKKQEPQAEPQAPEPVHQTEPALQGETISSMLEGYQLAPKKPVFQEEDQVEYLFIQDNPFGLEQERPTGSFGPFPMRSNSDKLSYGTGSMYLIGK